MDTLNNYKNSNAWTAMVGVRDTKDNYVILTNTDSVTGMMYFREIKECRKFIRGLDAMGIELSSFKANVGSHEQTNTRMNDLLNK